VVVVVMVVVVMVMVMVIVVVVVVVAEILCLNQLFMQVCAVVMQVTRR
jgi:hypothetical protein